MSLCDKFEIGIQTATGETVKLEVDPRDEARASRVVAAFGYGPSHLTMRGQIVYKAILAELTAVRHEERVANSGDSRQAIFQAISRLHLERDAAKDAARYVEEAFTRAAEELAAVVAPATEATGQAAQ